MENGIASLTGKRQLMVAGLVFLAVVAILSAGYYYFSRAEYVVIFKDLRPAEASAIVAELDRQGAAYELRDNGATILAPSDQAASIRIAVAGSDPALRGMVGFELFNESDMGLTDFAQRVNYQRALQGELARTIMLMDGVENARVHLAMPERSLFRGNRSEPKAAVTVIPQKGRNIDESRVIGIQRLVAAAVPDLGLADVVVLDETGRAISPASESNTLVPPEIEELEAVQQYYHARVRAAVEKVLPRRQFELRVIATPRVGSDRVGTADGSSGSAATQPSYYGSESRNFHLRIVLLTASELDTTDQSLVRSAVIRAVGLDEAGGDALVLNVAPIDTFAPSPTVEASPAQVSRPRTSENNDQPFWLPNPWSVLLVFITIALAFLAFRSRGPALSTDERDRFVRRIRDQLSIGSEGENARA